jgi:hypothetical protein
LGLEPPPELDLLEPEDLEEEPLEREDLEEELLDRFDDLPGKGIPRPPEERRPDWLGQL